MKQLNQEAEKIMIERFGKDTIIALATIENMEKVLIWVILEKKKIL